MSQEKIQAFEKLVALDDKRETLQGTKIFRMLKQLKSTHYAVNRNYQELSIAIAKYEGNSAWINLSGREFTIFFRELSRLLHNYLSSTFSLIRHNSRFCRKNPRIKEEYEVKVKALNSNDCIVFIKKLRNITQHVELPSLLAYFSREGYNQQTKQSIVLDRKYLLNSKEWRGSKRYIRSNQEIDLKVALELYQSLISDFYKWFYRRVGQLYSKELEEFATIERDIKKLQI